MFADPSSFLGTVFVLWAVHFLCDFALQSNYMAHGKNFKLIESDATWLPIMFAHCMIHALGVWVVTGSYWMAYFMLITHFCIDVMKCAGFFGFGWRGYYQDQFWHFVVVLLIATAYCHVFG